jgi:hypothetical protein
MKALVLVLVLFYALDHCGRWWSIKAKPILNFRPAPAHSPPTAASALVAADRRLSVLSTADFVKTCSGPKYDDFPLRPIDAAASQPEQRDRRELFPQPFCSQPLTRRIVLDKVMTILNVKKCHAVHARRNAQVR